MALPDDEILTSSVVTVTECPFMSNVPLIVSVPFMITVPVTFIIPGAVTDTLL